MPDIDADTVSHEHDHAHYGNGVPHCHEHEHTDFGVASLSHHVIDFDPNVSTFADGYARHVHRREPDRGQHVEPRRVSEPRP